MNQYAIQLGAGPWLSLAAGVVPELLLAPRVSKVVNASPDIHGLVNLRGVPVLILDPARALGVTATDKRRVLVLDRDQEAIAVLIVGEPKLLGDWLEGAQEQAVPAPLAPFVSRLGRGDAGDVGEFDHRGFLKAIAGVRL